MGRITRFSLGHPVWTLGLLVAVTGLLSAGLPRLTTEVGYRAFLGADHPSVRRIDAFVARFGGGLPMAAVWSCDDTPLCESVFDPAALEMAAEIAAALEDRPEVSRVASPATTALAVPTALGPRPRRFIERGELAPDRNALAERALSDPSWVGQLVSRDGRVGAVVAELSSSGSGTAARIYAALDAALAPWETRGVRFHRVGGPVEFVVAGGELKDASAELIPIMLLLVGATLVVLFRSLSAAAAVLLCVGIAVVWTLGLLGWLSAFGWAQNTLTQPLPPLILVIGVCDGIHLVARYASGGAQGGFGDSARRRRALAAVADDLGPPCFMTSVTTAAGFLSFASADLESFVRFGVLAAVGVMAALLLTFSLLPLALARLPPGRVGARIASRAWEGGLLALLRVPERHPRSVLGVALALAAVCAVGYGQLRVDATFEELYGEHSEVVRWARYVGDHLRHPDSLEVELQLPPETALADTATLETVAGIGRALAAIDGLGPARSVVDSLAWTRRLIRGDDAAFQRIADTAEENGALLAALAVLDPDGDALSRWVDPPERHVRISVESGKLPQQAMRRVMANVQELFESRLPEGWSGRVTGPLAVVHDMIEAIRSTQLVSFAIAGLAVLALVAGFMRSAAWALLALVPTVLPVVWTLGAMGLFGIPLDVGSAMVAAVVLGIAVDNAIHLLEQYRRRRRDGTAKEEAIREAVRHVGRALVTSSLALSFGFAALALSPWSSVASFGVVSAIAIFAALAAVLIVLPALLLRTAARAKSGIAG